MAPINSCVFQSEQGHVKVWSGGATHNWEWRYLGYTSSGDKLENPYFPCDDGSYEKDGPWNWATYDSPYALLVDPDHKAYEIPPQIAGSSQVDSWWTNIVFPTDPRWTDPAIAGSDPLAFWKSRMYFTTDPTTGLVILKAWFPSGSYITWDVPRDYPNLRITDYKVKDDNGNVLAEVTRGDDKDGNPTTLIPPTASVSKGQTLHIEATVKNETPPNHLTTATPVTLDTMYAYGTNATLENTWDKIDKDSVTSEDNPQSIPAGGTAHFKWGYTIPVSANQYAKVQAVIPGKFWTVGDNNWNGDDNAYVRFDIAQEDMELSDSIQLLDYTGTTTNKVGPGQSYTIRFFINKPKGNTPVGEAGNPNNPYATLDYQITDKGYMSMQGTSKATETLLPNGQVQVDIPNVMPQTSLIHACGLIDSVNTQAGQNDDISNDGWKCADFASEVNLVVNNLVASPQSINVPSTYSSGNQIVDFTFDLTNVDSTDVDKNVWVYLTRGGTVSQGGQIVDKQKVYLPPNANITVSWPESINLSVGSTKFSVEVNPPQREWYEFTADNNPFKDNVDTTTINVVRNPEILSCALGAHTNNTWTTQFTIQHHRGHKVCHTNSEGHTSCHCVTDSDWTTDPVVNFHENWNITHVFFRSKLTKDLAGGDGWVDVLTAPGKEGKIKAGYGFELKLQTNYNTNNYSSAPHSSSWTCSYDRVSPSVASYISSPNWLQVIMPYNDIYGNPVVYNLNSISASGSWDNMTNTYQLPYRNAFGLATVPEIFVSETTRDGDYLVQVNTPSFYGSPDKHPGPYSNLQDCESFYIKVTGGMYDDLKTQLIQ